jgi:nucleotide-binding universal stress UspA family protein
MKKVLIAVDRHASAEEIAKSGYAIARSMQAEVFLAHVITEPAYYAEEYTDEYVRVKSYGVVYPTDKTSIANSICQETMSFLSGIVSQIGDLNIQKRALVGSVEKSLSEYCKSRNIDLLIVGSHQRKGIKRLFLNDIVKHLLNRSDIPMLVIPGPNN